ncbi:MAG: hypothetical protein MET45_26110 [Nostoc sp. LLA-1]|nr:hypothetical protein [Cyanocohniella sp. LLY]
MSEEKPSRQNNSFQQISATERGIALALAVAVLVTFIVLILYPRKMDGGTLAIVRFLAATFAGIAGYLFTGNLNLEAKMPLNKTQVRATGAFAAFVLVLFVFFFGVPASSSDQSRFLEDNPKPAIEIAQFALNKEVSPYFFPCSTKVEGKQMDTYAFTEIGATLMGYLNDITVQKLRANGWQVDEVEILPEELAILPTIIRQDQSNSWGEDQLNRWKRELIDLPSAIRQEIEGNRINRAFETLTGLNPVFDVTFLNEGGKPLILTGIDLSGKSFGGGDVGAVAIPPLAVSQRYRIDIGDSAREISLTPPIKIPPDEALRIQVQFTDKTNGWYQMAYLLNLKFNFGGKISVSTRDFFLVGNSFSYESSAEGNECSLRFTQQLVSIQPFRLL